MFGWKKQYVEYNELVTFNLNQQGIYLMGHDEEEKWKRLF